MLFAAALLISTQPVTLSIVKPASSGDQQFNLVFANPAKQKLLVLNDECSWGHESTSFELKNGVGKIFVVKRIMRPWYRNFPMGDVLRERGTLVRPVNLADGSWTTSPVKGSLSGWQIRATYHPEPIPTEKPEIFLTAKTISPWTKL